MLKRILVLFVLSFLFVTLPEPLAAQTYYYDGGSISVSDLRRARTYKKGTYMLQGAKHRGIIWVPKYDARGNRYLALMLEHFLQGAEIKDYSPIQVEAITGGSHGMASVLALLMDLEARELLGIDKEKGTKINELFVDFRKQLNARMQDFQKSNRQATTVELVLARTAEIERLSMMIRPRLNSILSPEQIQRAREMVFQMYGGFDTAVVDVELLTLFDLDREQREKLELVAEDANEKRNKAFNIRNHSPNAADYQAFDKAMGDIVATTSRKIQAVMTKEQLAHGLALMEKAGEVQKALGVSEE